MIQILRKKILISIKILQIFFHYNDKYLFNDENIIK